MSGYIQNFFAKLKADKRLAIIVILGITGIILLTFSEIMPEKKEEKTEPEKKSDICEYEENLEKRLSGLVEAIDGAGRAKVMLTLASGDENIYATEDKSGEKSYERGYVIVKQDGDESGMLLKVAEPEIRGVAVVCEGAESSQVRQEIINTVCAVLGVGTNRVNISKMKSDYGG